MSLRLIVTEKNKNPLFENTIKIVLAIPKGKVTTYGSVARLANSIGSARYVSYILTSSSKKYKLPWHRVISASGKIANHKKTDTQYQLLKKEGIEVIRGKIDLDFYEWKPNKTKIKAILKS